MGICLRCNKFGLVFDRDYSPSQFIEGPLSSKVWIIGINPAAPQDWGDEGRSILELSSHLSANEPLHPYFRDFERVSKSLFDRFGKERGVAHTDIVKCSSKKWPPEACKGKEAKAIVDNCKGYLIKQIIKYKPRLIICNGAIVSSEISRIVKPIHDHYTYYHAQIEDVPVIVVRSGFIGRIDNYSRRRLGIEIDGFLNEIYSKT
ncbi:MAG: hypothetical protein GXO90_03550 [FCB group bacterium]|nr:hypothetical protein [FCB group bacterium]